MVLHRCLSLLVLILSLLTVSAADANAAAEEQGDIIGMVTGAPTGTYYRFGNDMKEAVAKDGVGILVKESKGSIANINRITSNENAASDDDEAIKKAS